MLLTGKTVLVVEPEPFAAYALERRLRDLDAEDVIVLRNPDDAKLELAERWSESERTGAKDRRRVPRAPRPGIAIIDFDESREAAGRLAADLARRHVKLVRTTRDGAVDGLAEGGAGATPVVRKPYDMIEIERAIGQHYGVLI